MDDVFAVCDRAVVMKNGAVVDTVKVSDVTREDVLAMIILGERLKKP
jgi:D-xylose transport system ATP-binding protein